MSSTIFITGGTRSGKSRYAEQRALDFGAPLCYLATAQPLDGEMDQRIQVHRERRGAMWQTVEEATHLSRALRDADGRYAAILVDCLTLWLTNLLLADEQPDRTSEARIMGEIQELCETLAAMTTPVIVVSNEVGMGIVPEHRLGRIFRDLAGQANQAVAAMAKEAWLVASGIPLRLK